MQRDLLDRLLRLQAGKCPAALVTDLESGDQALIEAGEVAGALALGEAEVADILKAVRARCKLSKMSRFMTRPSAQRFATRYARRRP